MENEALNTLLGNPLLGGGSVVGVALAALYYIRKMYLGMKQDSAEAAQNSTNLAATKQVVDILNDQVQRLTQQVKDLQDTVMKQSAERRTLIEEVMKLTRELENCRGKDNVSFQSTQREQSERGASGSGEAGASNVSSQPH